MAQPTTTSTNRQPVTAPHVITPPRPAVSQSTLAELLKRRRELKAAEQAVKAQKDALADRERSVIRSIEAGAAVSQGILTAEVRYEERRNVPWRRVAEDYLGLDFCKVVIEETEPTIYPRLVVA